MERIDYHATAIGRGASVASLLIDDMARLTSIRIQKYKKFMIFDLFIFLMIVFLRFYYVYSTLSPNLQRLTIFPTILKCDICVN